MQCGQIALRRPTPLSGDETILLVEDQEAVRESAAEYLAENGYTVLKASVGLEAQEIAKRRKQPIHLLLTDVVMPQMSGRELSEKITRIHPETKGIFMSGYSNNLLSNQQVLDPKHELVQKPFRLTTLGRNSKTIPLLSSQTMLSVHCHALATGISASLESCALHDSVDQPHLFIVSCPPRLSLRMVARDGPVAVVREFPEITTSVQETGQVEIRDP
jgi:CheY-like chemotaxis protein